MPRSRRRLCAVHSCAIQSLESRRLLATTELIPNGTFAKDGVYWAVAGDFYANHTFSNYNFAPGYAYLSGSSGSLATSNDLAGSLSQTVTIPSAATSAQFTFYYKNATNEPAGSTVDSLAVRVANPTTNATLSTLTTLYGAFPNNASYVKAGPFNLNAYIGQTVTLSFDGITNSTNGSVFRIDDVSLQATLPDSPGSVAAPTLVSPGIVGTSGLPNVNSPVPTLLWNKIAGALGYGIKVEQIVGAITSTIFNSETFYEGLVKGASLTLPMSLTAGTYRWSARAFDATGLPTAYSPGVSFTVATTGFNRAVGIDVSHWQDFSSVDWNKIKTNSPIGAATPTADDTSFIFTKATQGTTYFDPTYTSKMASARAVGIPIGAYHFPEPSGLTFVDAQADAVAEANYFYSKISSTLLAGNLVPVLDMENQDEALIMGRSLTTAWANAFMERIQTLTGVVPLIYCGVSYSSDFLDAGLLRYPLWRVQYPSTIPAPTSAQVQTGNPSTTAPWPTWSFWQYGSTGTVAGYSGNIDRDVYNGDVAALDPFKIQPATTYTITGTLFEDTNADGVRDAGELGIAGRTVFLDADGDSVIDTGERTAITNASGVYSFTNALQGNYQVRQVVPGTSLATTAASQSFKLAAGIANSAHDFGSRVIDSTPPTLATSRFDYDIAARTITLVFNEAVDTTQLAAMTTLTNLTTNDTAVPFTVTYNPATLTAVFSPTTLPLVDGNYRLTLPAGTVTDLAANGNAKIDVDFFSLKGDIDRDRAVGFSDLVILSQNYNTGTTYAQGDLTGDGAVDFADLVALSQSYNNALPSLLMAPPAVMVAPTKATTKKKPTAGIFA
jgi:GH25 family lysozyme M1 (1,4-beta-N-acetylmuramidase)